MLSAGSFGGNLKKMTKAHGWMVWKPAVRILPETAASAVLDSPLSCPQKLCGPENRKDPCFREVRDCFTNMARGISSALLRKGNSRDLQRRSDPAGRMERAGRQGHLPQQCLRFGLRVRG